MPGQENQALGGLPGMEGRQPTDGFPLGRAYKPDPRDRNFLLAEHLNEHDPTGPLLQLASDSLALSGVRAALSTPARRALERRAPDRHGATIGLRTRPWRLGPTLDQGSRPTCVPHAWLAFLLAAPLQSQLPGGDYPSDVRRWAEPAYRWMQTHDEWPGESYDGTSVRAGAEFLRAQGHILEYRWAWDVDTVKAWLRSKAGGPLVMGTDWFDGMFDDPAQRVGKASGYVNVQGNWVGGHAWLVHHYSSRLDAFRMRNSWGGSWGEGDDKGDAWMDAGDFQYLLEALNGEACAATQVRRIGEVLQSPIPQRAGAR